MGASPLDRTKLTQILFALALVATAVLTLVHGGAGTSDEIAARGEWQAIHVAQIFSYFAIGAGALAFGMGPARGDALRLAMAFVAVGALLAAFAHVVDGPVRVDMHEAGLGDGDTLYDLVMAIGIWTIVPGYVFMGVGGSLHALVHATRVTGVARVIASAVVVLFLLASTAGWGSLLLDVIPGFTFLAFVLGWVWSAVVVLRDVRASAAHLSPAPTSA